MQFKFIKIVGLFLLATALMGCPDENNCDDLNGSITRKDDLILLTPLQTVYNLGDIVTFKISIPATNNYFFNGESINLLQETNDYDPRLTVTYGNLFTGNQLIFIKGNLSTGNNSFNLIYNNTNQNYELEIKIKLIKLGYYNIYTNDSVEFQGSTKCNRFFIDTNILHSETGLGIIEFTVQ